MSFTILVDTGFWIALYDPSKKIEYSLEAERIAKEIELENIIIPFPTLYEFVNSRLSRRESKIQFENLLSRPNITLLSDSKYKSEALDNFFIKTKFSFSDVSLVDEVLKLIIDDDTIKIDYIVTFDGNLLNEALARGIRNV